MANPLAQRVSTLVRDTMQGRGYTQSDLAARLRCSQQAISRRLTGEVDFTITELQTIADFLGIPLPELLAAAA